MRKQTTLFGALAVTATLALFPMMSAVAEEVRVPVGTQADRDQASFPGSGMSQSSVRASWGAPVEIEGAEAVAKSYPAFFDDLEALGVQIQVVAG